MAAKYAAKYLNAGSVNERTWDALPMQAHPSAAGFKTMLPMITVALMIKAKISSSTDMTGFLGNLLR
jgi:hypothetical protein